MASWQEVCGVLEKFLRAERLNDELLRVRISLVDGPGGTSSDEGNSYSSWDVYIRREEIPRFDGGPGLEYVAIDASVGALGNVDLMDAVGHVGQLVPGLLSYAQGTTSGTLGVGTRIPAPLISTENPQPFLMLLYSIGSAARGVISELGGETGTHAYRSEQIRQSAWDNVRLIMLNDRELEIERDLGNGFIFWINGSNRRYRMFAGRNEPSPFERYVTFEYVLGAAEDIDLKRAADAAAATAGGVACTDGIASLRVSQHLTALTPSLLKMTLAQLLIAAEAYVA